MSRNAYARMARAMEGEQRRAVIVWGAPGSGKSTWAQAHAGPRDLVVDMDALCAALHPGGGVHREHSSVLSAAVAARDAIYRMIEDGGGDYETAYIVTASPDREAVDTLAWRMGGEVVTMGTAKDECLRRIRQDETRRGEEERFCGLVDEWFTAQD